MVRCSSATSHACRDGSCAHETHLFHAFHPQGLELTQRHSSDLVDVELHVHPREASVCLYRSAARTLGRRARARALAGTRARTRCGRLGHDSASTDSNQLAYDASTRENEMRSKCERVFSIPRLYITTRARRSSDSMHEVTCGHHPSRHEVTCGHHRPQSHWERRRWLRGFKDVRSTCRFGSSHTTVESKTPTADRFLSFR